MKTVIHVMRHGEVDNPDGILYGRLPGYGLTDLGIEMAEAVAEYFVDSGADITPAARPDDRSADRACLRA